MTLSRYEQSCDECRFFLPSGDRMTGECRRHAPRIARRPDREQSERMGVWPEIVLTDWCGEFAELSLHEQLMRGGADGEIAQKAVA